MKFKKGYIGILFGLGALVVDKLMQTSSLLADDIYYRGLFQLVRVIYDYTLGWIPIPMVYILFCLLVLVIAQALDKVYTLYKTRDHVLQGVVDAGVSLLSFIGWVLFAFYFLWGWNYNKTPFEKKMNFENVKADTSYLYDQALLHMESLIQKRRLLLGDAKLFHAEHVPENIESTLRVTQEELISSWGEPTYGRVRIRRLAPSGILLRISTAGVYIPFVCEGHIDAGLHPLQVPFTMAHEMAHGYGYTDEGVCNFVGYITCSRSGDPFLEYSGQLGYWRYVLSNLRSEAPHSYKVVRSQMPNSLQQDLNAIAQQMDKFPDLFPEVRNAVYDNYLKSHGVSSGIANYNDIVRLVAQYEKAKSTTIK